MKYYLYILMFIDVIFLSGCRITETIRVFRSDWIQFDIEWDGVQLNDSDVIRVDNKGLLYNNGPRYCREGYCNAKEWKSWQSEEYIDWLRDWYKMHNGNHLYINQRKFRFGKQKVFLTYKNYPNIIDTIEVVRHIKRERELDGVDKYIPYVRFEFIWRGQRVRNGRIPITIKHFTDSVNKESIIGNSL